MLSKRAFAGDGSFYNCAPAHRKDEANLATPGQSSTLIAGMFCFLAFPGLSFVARFLPGATVCDLRVHQIVHQVFSHRGLDRDTPLPLSAGNRAAGFPVRA
jgi:hypothetical protein